MIFFDGVCNLCNGFVQFIIKRDLKDVFRFGSLQSENVQEILKGVHANALDLTTVVLLENGNAYTESDAILRIVKHLHAGWRLFSVFIIVPKPIRNAVYRFVAKHRYRLFGRRESCMVPTPELKNKFL